MSSQIESCCLLQTLRDTPHPSVISQVGNCCLLQTDSENTPRVITNRKTLSTANRLRECHQCHHKLKTVVYCRLWEHPQRHHKQKTAVYCKQTQRTHHRSSQVGNCWLLHTDWENTPQVIISRKLLSTANRLRDPPPPPPMSSQTENCCLLQTDSENTPHVITSRKLLAIANRLRDPPPPPHVITNRKLLSIANRLREQPQYHHKQDTYIYWKQAQRSPQVSKHGRHSCLLQTNKDHRKCHHKWETVVCEGSIQTK